jgi:hypothetical protein
MEDESNLNNGEFLDEEVEQEPEFVREITTTDHINKFMMNSFKDLLDSGKFTFPEESLTSTQPDDFSEEEKQHATTGEQQQNTEQGSG